VPRSLLPLAHVGELRDRATQAARAYAAAALVAFRAAVTRADPLGDLRPPEDSGACDEPRLAPPPETGVYAIDAEARKLHATAVGAPLRRRGPAPKRRTRALVPAPPELPAGDVAALAEFLRGHVQSGALVRRLHPARAACGSS
jgi:hypothetical protein